MRLPQQVRKVLVGIAAFGALAVGGAAVAGAASSDGTTPTTTATTATPAAPTFPAHGSAAHEGAEQPVTGAAAAKAQAAVTALGGGTAGAVTTDLPGTGYEVTVTRADGSTVEVHLDGSFTVVQGRGPGGFGPAHRSAAHEDAEQPVTGSAATRARAAAVTSVGGGTAGPVTTDFHGSGYEVTVTKADGRTVEVHLDSSFTVVQGPPGPGFGG